MDHPRRSKEIGRCPDALGAYSDDRPRLSVRTLKGPTTERSICAEMVGISMIQVFENRTAHFAERSRQERLAAREVRNGEASRIHLQLAEMFERESRLLPAFNVELAEAA